MKRYRYSGPVTQFGKVVSNRYTAETMAVSKDKALSNLKFQFKRDCGLLPSASVTMDKKYLVEV